MIAAKGVVVKEFQSYFNVVKVQYSIHIFVLRCEMAVYKVIHVIRKVYVQTLAQQPIRICIFSQRILNLII